MSPISLVHVARCYASLISSMSCVTLAAVAPTADSVDKQPKLAVVIRTPTHTCPFHLTQYLIRCSGGGQAVGHSWHLAGQRVYR